MSPSRFAWESGRHPFEVLLHGWAVLNGAVGLLGVVARPRSIADSLPHWLQLGWNGLLLLGGAVGIIAAWQQGLVGHVEQGLRVEAAALWFLGGGALIYTIALFVTNGLDAFAAGSLIGSYGVAALIRIWHIWRETHGQVT